MTNSPNRNSKQNQMTTEKSSPKSSPDELIDIAPELAGAAVSAPLEQRGDDWSHVTKELLDSLPQVWTRGLLYVMVGFVAVVLPWALFSKVDETGTAKGRIEPKGKTLRLDTPITATVSSIKVKGGQSVRKGQPLLELESELARTELQQAQARLEGQLNRLTQIESSKNQLEIAIRTQRLQGEAQRTSQLSQMEQTKQQSSFAKNSFELAQERFDNDLKEVQRYRDLAQDGVVPEIKVAEVERSLNESKKLLKQASAEIQQARYKLAEQQGNYNNVTRSSELSILESKRQSTQLQAQIAELRSDIAQSENQAASLQFQLQRRVIRSPIDGVIFQLPTSRAGAVVQTGQIVAQIAPKGTPMVLKADIPSQQSGFLKVGMPVKLKFDAYSFQDYGIIEGTLVGISPDSETRETPQGKSEVYALEIKMSRNYVKAFNKKVLLTPGQTATAEVIIRERRIIDFFVDPFKQLQKDGVKL
jgi:hemolysin D